VKSNVGENDTVGCCRCNGDLGNVNDREEGEMGSSGMRYTGVCKVST